LKLLYYITSHGYGHAVRSVAICNALSAEVSVVLRTTVPIQFFKEEMHRPFLYEPASFDCGCIQRDGVNVDVIKTLETYGAIAEKNRTLLHGEVAWCQSNGIDLIASDITPFAFDVAHSAGIPAIGITNFTWHTIYKEYTAAHPWFAPYLDEIEKQYARADRFVALQPANDMPYAQNVVHAGIVGRIGADVRDRLYVRFGINKNNKIGLIYTGNFGMDSMDWKRLVQFDTWEFVGLYPLPGSPANYHCISKDLFRYQDCVASADIMVSKLGYGVCADCFANGLPIMYLPRDGFAEFPVLRDAVTKWGHGYYLSTNAYCGLHWHNALHAVAQSGKPQPMPATGASDAARIIEELWHNV